MISNNIKLGVPFRVHVSVAIVGKVEVPRDMTSSEKWDSQN